MTKNKSNNIKTILLGIVSILLVISIFFASKGLYNEINSNNSNEVNNKIYGTVSEVGTNYIKIKSTDNEDYVIFSKEKLVEGDFVVAYYDKNDEELINNAKIELIASSDEVTVISKDEKTTTTSTTALSTTSTTVAYTAGTTTKYPVVTTTVVSNNTDVVTMISKDYESLDTINDKETLKDYFIKYTDFIFYGTEINGVTFNSLTTEAKNKIVYYVLLIDAKIDSKFPGYKETIGSKYNNIKSKLIAEYMEAATNLCNQDKDKCSIVKEDLTKIKDVCKVSWDNIKTAFTYTKDKGISALKNWYEIYSGK